jgi:Uma2 family endonuclease
MARKPGPRATYADIEALPEHVTGELIDGELIVSPRPATPHAFAESNIQTDINAAFGRGRPPGGWWILIEPELHLHGDVLVPDIAGWRRERLPKLPNTVGIEIAPDWVCEIASPSTARIDRTSKMVIYAREGVPWLWIVDPVARTLEVFQRVERRYLQSESFDGSTTERVRAQPFEAIELDLSGWWLPE